MLVAGGLVTAGQVFAERYVRSVFAKSGDEALASVDVSALMNAAVRAFPRWFRIAVVARFILVTVGSLVVIVLLATPEASAWFR